jgi:hypothetical protein
LLEVAVSNAGMRKGMRGAQFAVEWAIAAADGVEFDGSVTDQVRAYLAWWEDNNERSAWRHLGEFREAFPGEETPARLAEQLAPRFEEMVARLRELQSSRRRRALGSAVVGGFGVPLPA